MMTTGGSTFLSVYQPGPHGESLVRESITLTEVAIQMMNHDAWFAAADKLDRMLLRNRGSVHHDRLWIMGVSANPVVSGSVYENRRQIPTYFMGGPWSGTWDRTRARQGHSAALDEQVIGLYQLWSVGDIRIGTCRRIDFYGSNENEPTERMIASGDMTVPVPLGVWQNEFLNQWIEKKGDGYGGNDSFKFGLFTDS